MDETILLSAALKLSVNERARIAHELLLSLDDQPLGMPFEPGRNIGTYQFLGLIGRGGMGEVYRARDIRLGRDVAIKVLPRPELSEREYAILEQGQTEWATTFSPSRVAQPAIRAEKHSVERADTGDARDLGQASRLGPQVPAGAAEAAGARPDEILALDKIRAREAELLRRFESEALLTASVQHPAVVPIYERGQLPDGRQFYAMKLISGRSLLEIIGQCKTLADRIALLPNVIAVAEALAHAHWQRILHRDVKPNNIVIGEFGEALLIDWGLAKKLADDARSAQSAGELPPSDRTAYGAIIGTPAYMSPEQAQGLAIDERADVFSLGATLYHLLAGRAPYEGETKAILPKVARGEFAPLSEVEPEVPGELAAIVNKAMAREPLARYPTARELAEDLRRFQTGQLVLSHQYSAGELLSRWARRNRALLAAAAVFLVVAAAGAAISVRRIVAERDRANREAEMSHSVAQFMIDMFRVSDPSEVRGSDSTVREILDRAAKRIEGGLTKNSEVQAGLMDAIARVFQSVGLFAKARPLQEKAVELRQRVLGPDHIETLNSMNVLATIVSDQGQYAEAEKLQRRVVEARRRVLGPEHNGTLDSMNNLANVEQRLGKYADAVALYRQVIDVRSRLLGPDHPRVFSSVNNLAFAEQMQGHYAEAEELNRRALEGWRRTLGNEHPDTLNSMQNLASLEQAQGHYESAQKLNREVLEIRRRVLGPEHPFTIRATYNLADVDVALRQHADAEKLFLEALETGRRVWGPQHPDLTRPMAGLGLVYLAQERFEDAEKILKEALELSRRTLGAEHPDTLRVMQKLAEGEMALKRYADAEKLYREVLETQRRVLPPDHPNILDTMFGLANLQAKQGRYGDAEKLHLETLALRRRVLGPNHATLSAHFYELGRIALRQGNRKKALDYLRQAVDSGLHPAYAKQMPDDDELKSLRGDPELEALLARVKKPAQP